MKKFFFALVASVAGLFSVPAYADTGNFTFSLDTSITPAAYVTSDANFYINSASVSPVTVYAGTPYKLTLTINGIPYSGTGATVIGTVSTMSGVVISAADGTYAIAAVSWTTRTACVRSGRAQHCQTYRTVVAGEINY